MDNRIDIFNLFKSEGKLEKLLVYIAKETVDDPYEGTKTLTYSNPLTIKGLIRQVSFESLHWKYYGQLPVGSIEVIAEKKYLTLFRTADKIQCNGEYYKTWKDDAKGFAILERADYVIVVLAKKEL